MRDSSRETPEGRDTRVDHGSLDKPERPLPDVWEAAFAWCPPPDSRLLGARDADGVGAAIRPDTRRLGVRRFLARRKR